MNEAFEHQTEIAVTRPSTIRPRLFAVVGDQALLTPLSYIDVECAWTRYVTTSELLQQVKTGRAGEVDAVVISTAASEPLASLADGAKSLTDLGIPTLILATSVRDLEQIQGANSGDLRVQYAFSSEGAGPALLKLQGLLDRDWSQGELVSLASPRYTIPLPVPTVRGYADVASDGRRARITTVVSDKGGVGKTSVSLMIAGAVAYETHRAENPQQVLVVDLDRQTQMRELVSRARVGVEQLTMSSTREDILAAIYDTSTDPECAIPNVFMLLGAPRQAEHLASRNTEFYEHVLATIQDDFDHIILDGSVGVTSDPVTRWAQQISDDVLYVLEADRIQYGKLLELWNVFTRPEGEGGLDCDRRKLVLVENRVVLQDEDDESYYADWDRALQRDVPDLLRFSIPEVHPHVRRAFKTDLGVLNLPAENHTINSSLKPLAAYLAGVAARPAGTPGVQSLQSKKRRWGIF